MAKTGLMPPLRFNPWENLKEGLEIAFSQSFAEISEFAKQSRMRDLELARQFLNDAIRGIDLVEEKQTDTQYTEEIRFQHQAVILALGTELLTHDRKYKETLESLGVDLEHFIAGNQTGGEEERLLNFFNQVYWVAMPIHEKEPRYYWRLPEPLFKKLFHCRDL